MEQPGFNSSPFEAPGEKPVDSEKKPKKKKKEQIAEQTKPLWSKLVGEQEPPKKDTQEKSLLSKEEQAVSAEAAEATGDAHEADETDGSVETLSESEQAEVVAAYIEPRLTELRAGRNELEDPADAAAREANIELLEALQVQAVEQSATGSDSMETEAEITPEDYELREAGSPEVSDEAQEFEEEAAIPLKARPAPAAGIQTPTKPPKRPSSGTGAGGQPPSGPAMNPNHIAQYGYPAPAAPNLAPNTNIGRANYQPDYRQNPNATYLLVGGLVGYFIGRRRGRIKTEKRMKVVQDKLEKQISETQRQVAEKELEVQKLAREQYWQRRASSAPERVTQPSRPVTDRRVEPASAAARPEYITSSPSRERTTVAGPEQRRDAAPKQTQELTRQELLVVGERVKIGDTNLKRIYEAKLISESGLKRLVSEHLESKDIRRGLAREFLAKELSYERDPHFRDLVPGDTGRSGSGGTKAQTAALDADYLQKLAAHAPTPGPNASGDSVPPKTVPSQNHKLLSNGLLAALTLIALGLAVYAVLLSLSR